MDIKSHIAKLERMASDNPAIVVLVVAIFLAVVFLSVVFLDALIRWRRQNSRRSRGSKMR